MKTIKHIVLVLVLCVVVCGTAKAQSYGLRTNVAAWATQTANLGVDFVLTETSTVHISAYQTIGASWFKDLEATVVQLEYRYWFAHQPLQDFFVGITATPAHYKMLIKEQEHDGVALPLGLNLGYSWPLIERLNLEVAAGAGMVYYTDRKPALDRTKHELTFSTTNLMIGLTYIIK